MTSSQILGIFSLESYFSSSLFRSSLQSDKPTVVSPQPDCLRTSALCGMHGPNPRIFTEGESGHWGPKGRLSTYVVNVSLCLSPTNAPWRLLLRHSGIIDQVKEFMLQNAFAILLFSVLG